MHDLASALDPAPHEHQAPAEDRPAVSLQHVGPDDDVHRPGLVLQRHEDHAPGAARPLAHQHETGGCGLLAVVGAGQCVGRERAPCREPVAQE